MDRRRFLALTGASLALAKMTGCTRQPAEHIVPYVRQPETAAVGQALYYATSMVHGGIATGLLVRSLTGRPIKVEGNPQHPASLGATDAFAQASVLSLYDPERAQVITRLGRVTTWARFATEVGQHVEALRAGGGARIRLLTETVTSPALAAEIAAFLAEFPEARWCRWEAAGRHHTRAGAKLSFGAPLDVRYDLSAADVVVAVESDLLASGPGNVRYARDFARRRADARAMNRLYSIESAPTCTGTLADHRLSLRPSEIGSFAAALAERLGVLPDRAAGEVSAAMGRWAAAIANDLRGRRGRGVIAVGEAAPPAVHVLAAAMNEALGNAGRTVLTTDPVEADPVDHVASLRELCADMRAGRVSLLVMLGGNPVFTAPSDMDFASAMQGVRLCVHLSSHDNETSERCHWLVPQAHDLEAWGDALAFDGTVSFVQPLIEPLHGGKSALEVMAALRGRASAAGRELLKAYHAARMGGAGALGGAASFEAAWHEALEDGFLENTAFAPRRADVAAGAAQTAASEMVASARRRNGYELALRPDPTIDDGRFAENGWLQELPKPHTKLTWDNAAILSPATAAELGVERGSVVEIAREGRAVRAPVHVLRGHPESTVTVHLGYGRRRGGSAAVGTGFDAYRLRTSGALWGGPGLLIRKTDERYSLATTQDHFELEGRAHVRTVTAAEIEDRPELIQLMGEARRSLSLYPGWKHEGRQWGMSIDLGACTGCSACVVACQAENNIPVVGKEQVDRGREMHWLRIDRYEVPAPEGMIVVHQPMMCVHCETAPCEYVCPVGATTHSAEGLNEMTYNRCVGTRYCSNNCPYKVRRFNFLQYHDLTSKTLKLMRNPDVTVRSRGVMEKCTYCVQRIAAGRIDAEREGRKLRDGEVVTACQQACPTGAIVFGDIHDPESEVHRLKADPRAYGVLEELGTRPRTTHLARIRNPNPELVGHG